MREILLKAMLVVILISIMFLKCESTDQLTNTSIWLKMLGVVNENTKKPFTINELKSIEMQKIYHR